MKTYSGLVENCWGCPFLKRGSLKTDTHNFNFTYCSIKREPVEHSPTPQAMIGNLVDSMVFGVETIPEWCPLPDKYESSDDTNLKRGSD